VEGLTLAECKKIEAEHTFKDEENKYDAEFLFGKNFIHDSITGCFKNECPDGLQSFKSVAPKLYSYLCKDKKGNIKNETKNKGVNMKYGPTSEIINYDFFKNLQDGQIITQEVPQVGFKSSKLEVRTIHNMKVGFNNVNDKRYISEDGECLPLCVW
jgi:hypothetical protein